MGVFYPQGVIQMRVVLENFGDFNDDGLNKVHTFTILCRDLTVTLNSYRDADTFSATIDYKNFPFDPRTIRSAGVVVHVEDKKKLFQSNNELNLLTPTEENTIFIGFADSDSIDLSASNRTVTLKGRDFTSLLIDREYLGAPIQLSQPLDVVLRNLLDQLEETRFTPGNTGGIEVVNLTGQRLPILADFASDKEPESGVKNARKNRSYWDQVQALVERSGLIAYISLDKLIVTSPRTLYNRENAKLFVFGENLLNLKFNRKLGRQKGFNIRVLSLNVERKLVLEARIPEQATQEWSEDIGVVRRRIQIPTINTQGEEGMPRDAPFITFRLNNITTFPQLVEVGQKIYEEVGRQQIEGSLTTKEMVVCDSSPERNFFDATRFRIGTPIEIGIDQGDLEGVPNLVATNRGNISKIKNFLISRCYSPQVAEAMAESLTRFTTPFFTKSVEFKISQESGWTMDIGFVNFIDLPRNLTQ